MRTRQKVWSGPRDYLIPNRRTPRRDGARANKVVYAIIKRLGERVGVDVHPHALRAAFAIRFDEQTEDVMALKDLLGHTRLEPTQTYLQTSPEAAKDGESPQPQLGSRATALSGHAPDGIRTRATALKGL